MGQKSPAFTWQFVQKKPWISKVQSNLMIPEQTLLLDITLIKLDKVLAILLIDFLAT